MSDGLFIESDAAEASDPAKATTSILCWHGWGSNLRVFDGLRAALRPSYRTAAVDLPGHGRSRWRDDRNCLGTTPVATNPIDITLTDANSMLARLLATLPAAQAAKPATALIGWSLGGQLALQAAALVPNRIACLVLFGTTPRFVRSPDWPWGVPATVLSQMHQQLAQDYRRTVTDFLELQVRGSRDAATAGAALRSALLAQGEAQPQALEAGLALLGSTDLRSGLKNIHVPTLVIAGRNDRVTLPAASAALADALPRATYIEYPRAAHAPFLSHLEELMPTLREFLRCHA